MLRSVLLLVIAALVLVACEAGAIPVTSTADGLLGKTTIPYAIPVNPTSDGLLGKTTIPYGARLSTLGPQSNFGSCFISYTVGEPPYQDRIVAYREIRGPFSFTIPKDGKWSGEKIFEFNTLFCRTWTVQAP